VYSLQQVHNDPIFEGMIENTNERDGHVSLESVFRDLAKKEINEVMFECGGTLNGALLKQNFIDEIIIYLAPCILGDQANNMFSLPAISAMSERYNFNLIQVDRTGDDIRVILRKANPV
jgi:diaminohydroxyphosphoribosylaminopyrimidine deaminase/5-amino-6-(5-phosphoribosylamino)uracil reductase